MNATERGERSGSALLDEPVKSTAPGFRRGPYFCNPLSYISDGSQVLRIGKAMMMAREMASMSRKGKDP